MSEEQQYPTREQIAELLWSSAADDNYDPRWTWAYLTELADRSEGDYSEIRAEYYSTADAVLALFPQPTPSAEPCTECQYVEGHRDDCERLDDYLAHRDDTTPRSIADMAPGTTFLGEKFEPRYLSRWTVLVRGQIMSGMAVPHNASEIDPSTIRDVTPPESSNAN